MGFFEEAKKFRPMDILEKAQGIDGMPTGDDILARYKEKGIDYGEGSKIYEYGQDLINRDSAYNQGIRADMESSSADAQAEALRQQQRMIAMGGSNVPASVLTAQGLQSANKAQAITTEQFEQGQRDRERRGMGVLSSAINNQAQLVQQSMGADQARNMAKANAYQQGLGIMGNLYNMVGDTAQKAGMTMMGIPPVPQQVQKGGYMKGYQEGGEAKFKPHMMYKGADEMMAKTYQDHLNLKAKGYGHSKGMMYGGVVKKMQTGDFVKSGGLLGMLKGYYNENKPDTSGGLLGMAGRSAEDGMLSDLAMKAGNAYQKTADYFSPDQERALDKINKKFGNYMDEEVTSDEDGATAVRRGDMWKGKALKGVGSILKGLGEGSKELSMPGYLMAKNLNLDVINGQQEGGYQNSVLNRIPMRVGGGKIG